MPARRILFGVGALCAANLLLEIALTRIFSALMFYHFTFFAIAVALLGMGAAGVYVYLNSERFTVGSVEQDMARYARWFAGATVLLLVYVLANPVIVYVELGESPVFDNIGLLKLALLCLVAPLPFFLAGVVVSLAITHFRAAIDRVYFFDLAGAGGAALAVSILMRALGGPGLVLAVAVLACTASLLFAPGRRSLVAVALSLGLLAAGLTTSLFRPPSSKAVKADRVVFDAWNTFSHVTVERMAADDYDICIDAAARTHVHSSRDARSTTWQRQITAFAYNLHPKGSAGEVLVIGPGGGIDVAHALASGARHVLGVEINPLIANDVMRGRFERASRGLYRDPRVSLRIDEGRSFIRRSPDRYDVIQATLVDTWAATASGAFALTENTLYTIEAFEDYYDHLSESGVLTMSRWWTFANGPETYRLVLLAEAALERRGLSPAEARQHLYLVRKDNLGTLLVKRSAFTNEEIERLERVSGLQSFEIVLSPTRVGDEALARMVEAGAWSEAVRSNPANLLPPTDDDPFFFYFVKPADLWQLKQLTNVELANPAIWLLGALTFMLGALTVLFVFVPLAVGRWTDMRGGGAGAGARRLGGLAYFAAIGFAFMVVEIALMQRLALFLGHPSYSLVVVLFAILAGSAAGARLSRRCGTRAVVAGGGGIAALAATAGLTLAPFLRALITLPLAERMVISAVIVFAFGLVMGLMLPLGVRLVSERDGVILPWAWGINGGMSVIGTVGATVIAINDGFTATFLVGAALYALAGGIGFALSRQSSRALGTTAAA